MFSEQASVSSALRRWVTVARRVADLTREQNVTFLAAGVAYYAFVSLLPAAVLALVVAVTLGGQRLADAVIAASAGVLTETGQSVLVGALVEGAGRGSVTLISLPLTVWGALKVFRGIDVAFSVVYGVAETGGFVDRLSDSVVVFAAATGGLLAMVLLGGGIAALDVGPIVEFVGYLALPALLTVAFLPLYYVFPEVDVTLREALPGAVFTGVGWTLLEAGFQAYVELQAGSGGEKAAVYGTLGAVLLLVSFLYFGANVVLVGAVINVVLADGRSGDGEGGGGGGSDRDGGDVVDGYGGSDGDSRDGVDRVRGNDSTDGDGVGRVDEEGKDGGSRRTTRRRRRATRGSTDGEQMPPVGAAVAASPTGETGKVKGRTRVRRDE